MESKYEKSDARLLSSLLRQAHEKSDVYLTSEGLPQSDADDLIAELLPLLSDAARLAELQEEVRIYCGALGTHERALAEYHAAIARLLAFANGKG